MKRIGVFGGSFDPPHNGHVRLALHSAKALSLDKILIIPSWISPHKQNINQTAAKDRYNMCKFAFTDEIFEVSDIEIKRGGTSYSIDTLRKIKKDFPSSSLYLIIGSDMLFNFQQWKEYNKILELCTLCASAREKDEDVEDLKRYANDLYPDKCVVLNIEPYEISSTEIRLRIKKAEDMQEFISPQVKQYIDDRKLYV